jgi:N-acetylmuramoyl-L-alanine amidase
MNSSASIRQLLRSLALFVGISVVAALAWYGITRWWPGMFGGGKTAQTVDEGPVVPFVVLDAGHGGMDTGTAGQGLNEKDGTLEIVKRIEKILRAKSINVVLTRDKDVFIELDQRTVPTQKRGAQVFVSIHLNATKPASVSGIETYFCSERKCCDEPSLRKRLSLDEKFLLEDHRSELLAGLIQQRATAATGAADRGVRDSHYLVARTAHCPAVLVECGYLTNKSEALRLKQPAYKDKLASAIAESVLEYLAKVEADPRSGLVVAAPPVVETVAAQQ